MALVDVLTRVAVVDFILLGIALLLIIGPSRLWRASSRIVPNLRAVWPTALLLAFILVLNRIVRDAGIDLSWIVGLNITSLLYALEGRVVPMLQSYGSPVVTAYFEFVYIYGYVFILVFPILAFLIHDEPRPLREHLHSYAVNYGIGVFFYIVLVAYGPRNFFGPETVESLLYVNWPQSQLLTSEVNTNTNVFPSLHASLSTTVSVLAYRFRTIYPRWMPLSWVLSASIIISVMYLGIHWATDVLAGFLLAGISVTLAKRSGGQTHFIRWFEDDPDLDHRSQ